MKTELVSLSEENLGQCLSLKVSKEQAQYISSVEDSLRAAEKEGSIARPFAICADGKTIGFTVLVLDEAYEDPNDRYWLWKFMIDESFQGKGYGTAALQEVIRYLKSTGQATSGFPPKKPIVVRCPCTGKRDFVIRGR
ncbi:MAG: GNAT family N-acetyltransferase [Lachnospiraceae bacterium]|nr:GNAT family N-acetyltransferase [Lachnospiraceae bacterium]